MSSLALPLPSLPQPSAPSASLKLPSAAAGGVNGNGNGNNAVAGPSQPKKRVPIANGSTVKDRSASPLDEEDEDEEEEDDEPRKKKKKASRGAIVGEYKYSNEIAAMVCLPPVQVKRLSLIYRCLYLEKCRNHYQRR